MGWGLWPASHLAECKPSSWPTSRGYGCGDLDGGYHSAGRSCSRGGCQKPPDATPQVPHLPQCTSNPPPPLNHSVTQVALTCAFVLHACFWHLGCGVVFVGRAPHHFAPTVVHRLEWHAHAVRIWIRAFPMVPMECLTKYSSALRTTSTGTPRSSGIFGAPLAAV